MTAETERRNSAKISDLLTTFKIKQCEMMSRGKVIDQHIKNIEDTLTHFINGQQR